MRVYAILGFAVGQEQAVLAALPNTEYKNGSDGLGERLEHTRNGDVYSLLIWRLASGVVIQSASWDIWLLAADSKDAPGGYWKWMTRAYRFLRRQSALYPGYILGPFSIAEFRERWPTASAQLLDGDDGPSWPIIAGDAHPTCEAVDYRPSQMEIDTDTDTDESTLFGGGQ